MEISVEGPGLRDETVHKGTNLRTPREQVPSSGPVPLVRGGEGTIPFGRLMTIHHPGPHHLGTVLPSNITREYSTCHFSETEEVQNPF